ncbi:DUF2163 domain-containing protein [Aurantiacibacter poecillastricola]|uniref:DUF2163 domain-containing protein n=1 Tax=Aurantiacibacter poecillastricola TaxID=3064385 RepID=UPI00273DAA92|nr:DUF2163 domain-containing protein [Aurantiacibacter sp. 219JJ12-13]MDP5260317.1 DUF2163 domain-containing protein [Aurantiacibacter sp. 219JJ12-13]
MSRIFFASELEGVATYWRIMRTDGLTLGFTSHNRTLTFEGIAHLAAPGMLPSAIRRSARLERDSVEVQGILSHDAISAQDLEDGRYADARITVGLVAWDTLEHATLFQGRLGNVSAEDVGFVAELRSAKADFEMDIVPRTSPTCRAVFCDRACRLHPARFTRIATVEAVDTETNAVTFTGLPRPSDYLQGELRWIDGPLAGLATDIVDVAGNALVPGQSLSPAVAKGMRAYLREGCDHTIATCASRFGNATNFQGEPFLPGNDLLTRYPTSAS